MKEAVCPICGRAGLLGGLAQANIDAESNLSKQSRRKKRKKRS